MARHNVARHNVAFCPTGDFPPLSLFFLSLSLFLFFSFLFLFPTPSLSLPSTGPLLLKPDAAAATHRVCISALLLVALVVCALVTADIIRQGTWRQRCFLAQ